MGMQTRTARPKARASEVRATGFIRFIFLTPVTLLLEFLSLQHPTSNHIPGRAKKIQICPRPFGGDPAARTALLSTVVVWFISPLFMCHCLPSSRTAAHIPISLPVGSRSGSPREVHKPRRGEHSERACVRKRQTYSYARFVRNGLRVLV